MTHQHKHEQFWLRGQDLHVKIRGLDDEPEYNRETVEDYIMSRLNPLSLDLNIIWDDELAEGGISFYFHRDIAYGQDSNPFVMRKTWGFRNTDIEYPPGSGNFLTDKVLTASIRINLNYMDKFPADAKNRYHAFRNIVLHEFLHGLGICHLMHINIGKKKKGMLETVMKTRVSTDKLYWTKSAEMALRRLYGGVGKKFTFTDEDIGKTVYFLHWWSNKKSFALPVDRKVMYVHGVKHGYKVVVR